MDAVSADTNLLYHEVSSALKRGTSDILLQSSESGRGCSGGIDRHADLGRFVLLTNLLESNVR